MRWQDIRHAGLPAGSSRVRASESFVSSRISGRAHGRDGRFFFGETCALTAPTTTVRPRRSERFRWRLLEPEPELLAYGRVIPLERRLVAPGHVHDGIAIAVAVEFVIDA